MKKLLLVFACLLSLNLSANATDDKPIDVTQLPKEAQAFYKKYFASQTVALAKMDTDIFDKSYDVIFTSGDMLEFDSKGVWTKVSCIHSSVPQEIIPAPIKAHVQKQYPSASIVEIEKTDRKGYEVKLSNGVELDFDKSYRLLDVDVD